MGGFVNYLSRLEDAKLALAPYIGKPFGKDEYGNVETYFSATPSQKADSSINRLFGSAPGPVVNGVEVRDSNRLDYFGTKSGSVLPIYPAEELLLGGAITNRLIGTLGRAFASLDVELAGTANASTKGFISTQQITTEGMQVKLASWESDALKQLNGTLTSNQEGILRERVVDSYFTRNGFTSLEGKCGSNCFDGVYVKGDKVYINEVKPLNANGSIKLNGPEGSLPAQMSDEWIVNATERLGKSNTPNAVEIAKLIESARRSGNLVKIVTGVNENGVTVVKLK